MREILVPAALCLLLTRKLGEDYYTPQAVFGWWGGGCTVFTLSVHLYVHLSITFWFLLLIELNNFTIEVVIALWGRDGGRYRISTIDISCLVGQRPIGYLGTAAIVLTSLAYSWLYFIVAH